MAQVQGTDNPDLLNGTPGDDTITGLKGDDILDGLGGADLFVWSRGDGADTVNGGDDSDTFQATIPYYEDVLQILGQFTFDDTEKGADRGRSRHRPRCVRFVHPAFDLQ